MKIISCLALAFLAVVAVSSASISEVDNGFTSPRSGNIMVFPKKMTMEDVSMIVMDFDNKHVNYEHQKPEMNVENVADVVAEMLGLPAFNPDFEAEFVKKNLFNRPRANLMVTVSGLSADLIKSLKLKNLEDMQRAFLALNVKQTSYPQSSSSIAATLSTGRFPKQHGIVADSWKSASDVISAFDLSTKERGSFSQIGNLADLATQIFPESSLVVSISSERPHALAHVPHRALSGDMKTVYSFAFDARVGTFVSALPTGEFASAFEINTQAFQDLIRSEAFLNTLSKHNPDFQFAYDNTADAIVFSAPSLGLENVRFALHDKEINRFFGELAYMLKISTSEMWASGVFSSSVRDNVPDMLFFTLSTLKDIAAKFGEESKEFHAAAHIADSAVYTLVGEFSSIYGGKLVSEVVAVPRVSALPEEIAASIARVVPSSSNIEHLPSIYVEGVSTSSVCEDVKAALIGTDYDAYCPTGDVLHAYKFFSVRTLAASNSSNSTNTTVIPSGQIQRYQIVLWFSIGMTFVLYVVLYNIAFMENRRDTLLYGKFSVNADSKKRQ